MEIDMRIKKMVASCQWTVGDGKGFYLLKSK